MLKLNELTVSKELDSKAMAGVRGGTYDLVGLPFDMSATFDFMSVNQPSAAGAATGPQTIGQGIDDRDIAVAGDGGIAFNYSNNHQTANNVAVPTAISAPIAVKGSFPRMIGG